MVLFLKEILPIIRLFQFVGISPFAINHQTLLPEMKLSKQHKWFIITLLFLSVCLLIHSLVHTDFYINWTLAAIIRYMDVAQLLSVQAIVIIVLVESLVKRRHQIEIMNKIIEIDDILITKIHISLTYEILHMKTRQQAVFWISENIFMFVFIITAGFINKYYKFMKLWLLYAVPLFVLTLKYFQFTIFVGLVTRKMHILIDLLRNMMLKESNQWKFTTQYLIREDNKGFIVEPDKLNMHRDFVNIRRCLHLLWKTHMLINQCFHWSLLFLIGNDFVVLVKNLYWIFHWMVNSTNVLWSSLILSVQWTLLNIWHFVIVCSVCNGASSSMKELSALVHQLNMKMRDKRLANLVSTL